MPAAYFSLCHIVCEGFHDYLELLLRGIFGFHEKTSVISKTAFRMLFMYLVPLIVLTSWCFSSVMVQVNTSSWILAEIIITSLNIFTFDLMFESNSYSAKITVIITAYNRSKFIDNAILSVINQTIFNELYEIVVVKNFSDEVTDALIKENNVKSIMTGDCSIGEMLVEGIQKSSGDIICFLDDDDLFHRDKLKIVHEIFTGEKEIIYYRNDLTNNQIDLDSDLDSSNEHVKFYTSRKSLLKLDYRKKINMSTIALRKEVLIKNLNYITRITSGQDFIMFYLALLQRGMFALDNRALTFYRRHPESVTLDTSKNDFTRVVYSISAIESIDMPDFIKRNIQKTRIHNQLLSYLKGEKFSNKQMLKLMLVYVKSRPSTIVDFLSLLIMIGEVFFKNSTRNAFLVLTDYHEKLYLPLK